MNIATLTRLQLTKLFLALVSGVALSLFLYSPVNALSGSDFNPGRIIDDAVFFDYTTMTQAEIQSFLENKMQTCDEQGNEERHPENIFITFFFHGLTII